jgi:hypothetical protein
MGVLELLKQPAWDTGIVVSADSSEVDVARDFLAFPMVWLYFLALGGAISISFKRLGNRPAPLLFAIGSMAVCWTYIFLWMLKYKRDGGKNTFDDAYVDVLRDDHFGTSAQLLTWVVVAAVWIRGEPLNYMVFGMLGAMSAAYVTWIPRTTPGRSARMVPASFAMCSAATWYSIAQLQPSLGDTALFHFWIRITHVFLVAPAGLCWLWPGQPTVDGRLLYGALAAASVWWHWAGFEGPVYAAPVTAAQKSITIDLALCTVLTLYAIYRDTAGSVRWLCNAAIAAPVLSPAAVLALHLMLQ